MAKDFSSMEDSNRSSNPSIHDVSRPGRRTVSLGGASFALASLLAPVAGCAAPGGQVSGPKLGFKAIAASEADALAVPEGYFATAIAAWVGPIGIAGNMPAFRFAHQNSGAGGCAAVAPRPQWRRSAPAA